MMQSRYAKMLLTLGAAAALGACAAPADHQGGASLSADDRYAQVHAGYTQDEVRRLAGEPHKVITGWRSGQTVWAYNFTDAWGYSAEFDVMFASSGVVASTFSQRLNP